jgi:hypothetical protein
MARTWIVGFMSLASDAAALNAAAVASGDV